jgi:cell division protein FtsB
VSRFDHHLDVSSVELFRNTESKESPHFNSSRLTRKTHHHSRRVSSKRIVASLNVLLVGVLVVRAVRVVHVCAVKEVLNDEKRRDFLQSGER